MKGTESKANHDDTSMRFGTRHRHSLVSYFVHFTWALECLTPSIPHDFLYIHTIFSPTTATGYRLTDDTSLGMDWACWQFSSILLSLQEDGGKGFSIACLIFAGANALPHLPRISRPYLPHNHPVVRDFIFSEDRLSHPPACSAIPIFLIYLPLYIYNSFQYHFPRLRFVPSGVPRHVSATPFDFALTACI